MGVSPSAAPVSPSAASVTYWLARTRREHSQDGARVGLVRAGGDAALRWAELEKRQGRAPKLETSTHGLVKAREW